MAELDIGKHCTVPSCKQLDFLPIQCDGCSRTFCKDHSVMDAHACSQASLNQDRPEFVGPKSHACSVAGCKKRELTPITCEACSKIFCLEHRHQVDHGCEKYEPPTERMTQTTKHVQDILASKQQVVKPTRSRKPRSEKAKATAAKIALMKIKAKALGDKGTPETERVYLTVFLPTGSKEKTMPMFFSKVWTVGRVIDKIAEIAGLRNENNVSGAKKLRVFDWDTGCVYYTDQSLGGAMSGHGLCNGGSVICEYVEDTTQLLSEIDLYK